MERENSNSQWRGFWFAILAIFLAWLIWRLSSIILPFALAGLIAFILNPLVDKLESKGWTRGWAIALIMLSIIALALIAVFIIVPVVWNEITLLIENYAPLLGNIQGLISNAINKLRAAFPWLPLSNAAVQEIQERVGSYLARLLERTPTYLAFLLQGIAGFILLLVVTLILAYWFLKEYHSFGRRLMYLVPHRYSDSMPELSRKINQIASSYLLGLAALSVAAGIFITIILLIFGVSYSYLLGILVAIGYMIPYFGLPVAAVIIALVALVTGHSWATVLAVISILAAVNLVLDYVFTPRIIGSKVGLHPMTVIFALFAFGELFGFLGIIIAMPLAAAIRITLATFFPDLFMPRRPTPDGPPAHSTDTTAKPTPPADYSR